MKPQSGGIKAFLVGLAGSPDTSEIADELEGGQGVMGPSQLEPLSERRRRSVRNHMEEEIKAGVTGGEEGGRVVLGENYIILVVYHGFVEIASHGIHERIAGGGWSIVLGSQSATVDLRWTHKSSHGYG